MPLSDRCVIGRDNNVVMVDFRRKPDPPAPRFPGANGLRLGSMGRNKLSAFLGAVPKPGDARTRRRWRQAAAGLRPFGAGGRAL